MGVHKDLTELQPIKESPEDFDRVEAKLRDLFRKELYLPLMKELSQTHSTLKNAVDSALAEAIRSGKITFNRGVFSGRFSAQTSSALKELGAKWDRKNSTWKIALTELPIDLRYLISATEFRFGQKIEAIDKKLSQILPEEIADKIQISKEFDATLWKTEKKFQSSVSKFLIAPKLSREQSKKISDEWQNNMKLWIKDFTQKEIVKLRSDLKKSVLAGDRYGSVVKTIQDSYDVSLNKAKFLARQETSLLMTKFKETRYTDAGVNEYIWCCVKMPHQQKGAQYLPGEVRYDHGILEGKIFRWDNPPVTDEKGSRNNPGEDYNCRCFAKPVVRFKK